MTNFKRDKEGADLSVYLLVYLLFEALVPLTDEKYF